MELTFRILAVILAGVAAYFLWQGNGDRAFVAAVCGSVSFFLSVRAAVKQRNDRREIEREEQRRREEEEIFNADAPLLNEMNANFPTANEQRTTNNERTK